jgi:hypothetical protein
MNTGAENGPPGVSRRTALGGFAALGAAVASGCTAEGPGHPGPTPGTAASTPDPDVTLSSTVLVDEQAILDLLVATVDRHPLLAGRVAGARAGHHAHVVLLTEAVPKGAASDGPAARHRHPVPDAPTAALAALAGAEDRLALLDRRSALAAESGALARVLASMAAAASQQAVWLAGGPAQDRR